VLRAEGRGRRWILPGSGTLFAGWRGNVHIAGKDLNVKMWSGILEVSARGTGWGRLKGRGYSIGQDQHQSGDVSQPCGLELLDRLRFP
jgi:hypothetical protein